MCNNYRHGTILSTRALSLIFPHLKHELAEYSLLPIRAGGKGALLPPTSLANSWRFSHCFWVVYSVSSSFVTMFIYFIFQTKEGQGSEFWWSLFGISHLPLNELGLYSGWCFQKPVLWTSDLLKSISHFQTRLLGGILKNTAKSLSY